MYLQAKLPCMRYIRYQRASSQALANRQHMSVALHFTSRSSTQQLYPSRSIRTLQDNVPAETPIAGLRDASNPSSSSGAQRPAGSAEKSLVSSSAEALYRQGPPHIPLQLYSPKSHTRDQGNCQPYRAGHA